MTASASLGAALGLDDYLRGRGLKRRPPEVIARGRREGPFALSFAQQRIWFVEQAVPNTSMYNMPECARIRGELDLDAVRTAAEWVVSRHEAWRTTFELMAGRPVQRVHPELAPEFSYESSPDEVHARARLAELCGRPFDLSSGPLVRLHVIALAEQDHMLLLNVHHIVSDGWSTGLFVREFVHAYRALATGRRPELPEPALQFGDYVVWQEKTLSGPAFEALVRRWAKMAGPRNGYARLPADRPTTARPDDSGDFVMLALGREATDGLRSLAQRLGVTMFVLLSAAFKLTLARLTGVWSVSLGVPVAGRDRRQLEEVMGLFANTLILHSNLSGDPTLEEAVGRERRAWIAAQSYQHAPFERLVELMNPSRSAGDHPFFQIMFILQNTPMPPAHLPGASLEFIATGTRSVKFDLVFELYETEEGLRGWLGYQRSHFDEGTVARLMRMFHIILSDLPAGEQRQLSAIGLEPAAAVKVDDFLAPL
jgi:hypothetical protein